MSKPASLPTWATDTNIASGSETGTPTKVEPSSGYKTQGLVPGLNFIGPYFNWLLNLVYQWCAYLDALPSETAFVGANFAWTGTHTTVNELGYPSAKTRTKLLSPSACVLLPNGGDAKISSDSVVQLKGDGALFSAGASWALDVPSGATITGVRAGVREQNSNGAMILQVWKQAPDMDASPGAGTLTVLDDATVATGNAAQVLTTSFSEVTASATNQYYLTIFGGVGSSTFDEIYWVEITYTETRATGSH